MVTIPDFSSAVSPQFRRKSSGLLMLAISFGAVCAIHPPAAASPHNPGRFDTRSPSADRPNVVLIMADDMGFSDLGCYGGEVETPNLDRLAANGLRFTQFYNTGRCCPTRAALLTGLYQHQAGIGHMTADYRHPSYRGFLNDRCTTLAEVLRDAGYQTLMAGKWHVGGTKGQWPLDRGFDRYFGSPSGGGFYFAETMAAKNRFLVLDDSICEFPPRAYVTDLFTDHAIDFVNQAAESKQPFFLYLAHIAPHWPLQAHPKDIEKYRHRYTQGFDATRAARYAKQQDIGLIDESWTLSDRHPQAAAWNQLSEDKRTDMAHRMAVYAAQIDSIDQNLGRLIESLKANDAFENTLILFLSDNGCSAEGNSGGFRRGKKDSVIGTAESYASAGLEWANVCDTPLRRFKMSTHEGGISTPLIAHWPAGIQRRGEFETQPGHVIDFMPTLLQLAHATYPAHRNGAPLHQPEGISLVPAMQKKSRVSRTLYWEHQGNTAIRAGDWKLVKAHKEDAELYNLRDDRSEMHNLSEREPARVRELQQSWRRWSERVGVLPWPAKESARQVENSP